MRLLSLLFASVLLIAAAQAETVSTEGTSSTQCGPGPAGAPCGGEGPASQGNPSGTNQGAGNPINVITGNKYQQEVDLPALPGVLGLEIVRHYNSSLSGPDTPPGILGRGWRLSYETDLYPIGNTLQIVQADGTRILFIRDPQNPSQCATRNPIHGRLTVHQTARGEEYVWTWTNGRRLSFNHQGKLVEIRAPSGEFVSLTRDPVGVLVKVTDPQGRSLTLSYPQHPHPNQFNGVVAIDSPVGRFGYAYGSASPKNFAGNPRELLANLVRVDLPGDIRRYYHYDDPAHPTLLTGISVAGKTGTPQRINTWAYDNQGRGILSVRGEPKRLGPDGKPVAGTGIEQVNLDYAPGKTTLTNSLGQTTTYTHAIIGNEYRLLEVRGAGCASCGEANVKYGYDKLGRLIEETKLSSTGQPLATTKTERDALGRPLKIARTDYVNGKPRHARLMVRYEYGDDSDRPTLIARPSVVPGKEHQVRIAYNAHGQPLVVTETGFSPINDRGEKTATPITRTVTYSYRTINNRSVLAAIDGPLPNGKTNSPADSDVTWLEWDDKGSAVVRITQPAGATHTVQYDAVGRIAAVSNAEHFKTTFIYDTANRLVRTVSSGANWTEAGIQPVVQSYRYDDLGNLVETGRGGPIDTTRDTNEETYRPQIRRAFDVAGRLLWQAEAIGILKHARYDTEGHLLSSTVQTRSFEQTERYRYDAFNRLVQVWDSTGSVRNVAYGKPRPATPSAFRVMKDDFGREVLVESRSHGTRVKRYDAADQLIEQRSDKGHVQTYSYDLTGRITRHTVQPNTGAAEITTWRYAQGRLAEVSDPVQTERIRYNERGLPASRTVTVKLLSGAEATYITRYSYTPDGSLASQSLPDGTKLLYERNGQGQIVAVQRQSSPWTFFGWGKTPLVKDLERDLIGLRHVTYGNGIQAQWQRSKQGVLARVVYTQPEGRAANSPNVVATSQGAVRQVFTGGLLGKLLPVAHAQPTPAAPNLLLGALGLPADPRALFDARLLYDSSGNVLLQKQQGQGLQHTQAYAYDRQSQLIVAQSSNPTPTVKTTAAASDVRVWRYHYDANGNRVLAQENVPVAEMGHTRKAHYDPESDALLTPAFDREYVWNAQGQLIAIRQGGRELARYRYNHQGLRIGKQTANEVVHTLYNDERQRIADLDAHGRIIRQYIWLGDQLIATLDAQQPKALQAPAEGFFAELAQTLQALWNSVTANTDRLAFVHVNHLGAPVAATDEAGRILWQVDYAPYGGLIRTSASPGNKTAYTLALRLPGQWEDAESGLYYNDFRYYDPHAGRYLSPDPLGRLAERLSSPNAYAYVNNNPLSYIDPWGLILFAFDGTENSDPVLYPGDSLTNVVNFRDLYASDNGRYRYITGVGTVDRSDPARPINAPLLDAGVAWSGPARISRMIEYFGCTGSDYLDTVLQLRPPFAWHKPDGLRGVI
jgi:RHS repeat-associated protein